MSATGTAIPVTLAYPPRASRGESTYMSIAPIPGHVSTSSQSRMDAVRLLIDELDARPLRLHSFGAKDTDRQQLADHLARKALHGSPSRNFRSAWRIDEHGQRHPKLLRMGTKALSRCQYVVLTHPQRSAVLVLDVDRPGIAGGEVENVHPSVLREVSTLAAREMGPAWIGVNPIKGTCQLIWLIDPVYAGTSGESKNTRLLKATKRVLGEAIGGDCSFAHQWSRSPFYDGGDPTAYRWHIQHHRVNRVADLMEEARAMTGEAAPDQSPQTQRFSSGRELLEAVKARRAEAEQFQAMASELSTDLPSGEALEGDRIDGVRVLWISPERTARDETAFRHALAQAHRLRAAGQRMSDDRIIDAYERAYKVAHAVGADNRGDDMPPIRDRRTMARRVRGYVLSGKSSRGSLTSPTAEGRANSRERKALAAMGSRGGKKAAERWKDRDSEYAQAQLSKLEQTQRRKKASGQANRARVLELASQQFAETGKIPTWRELMKETGLSKATVARHVAALRKAGMWPEI